MNDTVVEPDVTVPEFAPYWELLRAGSLAFPRCSACGRHHWYPMQRCPWCGGGDITWAPVCGQGVLYSWTVVRHAFAPDYADKIPYVVALVEFPDAPGVRLVTQVLGEPDAPLRCGMQLAAVIEAPESGRPTVRFRVA
jgi:uncharacterized OB-fold protein